MSVLLRLIFLSLLLPTFLACSQNTHPHNAPVLENNSVALASRVTYSNTVIELEAPAAYNKAATGIDPGLQLTLVAAVMPPSYLGSTLQANEVVIKGNKVYVGYNVKGETFLGAVDVFDISDKVNPTLISSVILPGVDVNGIAVRDNDLYIAAAGNDESLTTPAMLGVMRLQGGLLSSAITRVQLPSYAGTDVDIVGNNLFVTSGSAGGAVKVLNTRDSSTIAIHLADDVRGIDADATTIATVSGKDSSTANSATLTIFDKDSGAVQNSFPLAGATIPVSKSTVEVKNGKAILALGDGGTQIVCLASGAVLETIEQPLITGLDASLTVTNAASAYKNALFMASGEAGVYVALSDSNFATPGCDVQNLRVVGKLVLGDLISANHIAYRNDMLFVASGLGGLQVITVNLGNDLLDDDDATE